MAGNLSIRAFCLSANAYSFFASASSDFYFNSYSFFATASSDFYFNLFFSSASAFFLAAISSFFLCFSAAHFSLSLAILSLSA